MTLARSDLAPDPNPLAQVSETGHPIFLFVSPPKVNEANPLSSAQHNGFVDGAKRSGNVGFLIGALAGAAVVYVAFVRR